jgi:cytochrome c-type protein NrfB
VQKKLKFFQMNLIKNRHASPAAKKLILPSAPFPVLEGRGQSMRRGLILFISAAMVWIAGLSLAETDKGAKEMVIPSGGNQGDVKFPHHQHQEALTDCMLCHDLFPQQAGAIQDLKQKGILAQKQVMNKQCVKCHKAKKDAGEKSGPVTCTQCHAK